MLTIVEPETILPEIIDPPKSNFSQLVADEQLLPLNQYDKIVVSFSGGKDSLAMVLQMLEAGVPKDKLELWHQHVDGAPGSLGLMDWPVTESYCRAVAQALEIPLRFQWKVGGFEGEMLRKDSTTKGVCYEDENGNTVYLPSQPPAKKCKCGYVFKDGDKVCPKCDSNRKGISTRLKFPQLSADLNVRWCSAYVKIDVARRAMNNDPRFKRGNFLFLTGERREESTARSNYDEVPDPLVQKKRRIDYWRSVIDWNETHVWDIIRRWKITPHPAYQLGWGRVSCMMCIFADKDQWASAHQIAPNRVEKIMRYEREFDTTIKRNQSVEEQIEQGESFVVNAPAELIEQAMGGNFTQSEVFTDNWTLPKGAFRRCGGPI